jgi:hypothetical protein
VHAVATNNTDIRRSIAFRIGFYFLPSMSTPGAFAPEESFYDLIADPERAGEGMI